METKVSEFTVQDMLPLGLTFVVVAIALAYGATVLSDVKDDQTANSFAYNTTVNGESALNKFGSKLPLIATVIVAAIIIGILINYLAVRMQ